jgi:hypothetical protein
MRFPPLIVRHSADSCVDIRDRVGEMPVGPL